MMKTIGSLFGILFLALLTACEPGQETAAKSSTPDSVGGQRLPVLFDTDANNELDDQHAMAYLLFQKDRFDVRAVTVNATFNGGDLPQHYAEAARIMALCQADSIPLLRGANADFLEILPTTGKAGYDGEAAVAAIIREARAASPDAPLILLPVGKLTNIALALALAPDIADRVRIVWLGSNYPEPGEYNLVNDTASLTYVLQQDVPFEMVTVRYGKPSGTDAVRVTPATIAEKMPGQGPKIDRPITGRHGGSFDCFGDYSQSLFEHAELHGDPPSRALFDMAAVAIVKDSSWAERQSIPAPRYVDDQWIEQPNNPRQIWLWENFDKTAILDDFFAVMAKVGQSD